MLGLILFLLLQQPHCQESDNKGFGAFLESFCRDTTFQRESVIFPLLYTYYDERFGYYIKSIEKDDFAPTICDLSKCRLIINRESQNMYKVEVQVQDTDTGYICIFIFINNQWYLNTLIDSST